MTGTAHCARCGTSMPAPAGRAALRRFCGDSCRKAAWRDRHHEDAPDDLTDIVPTVVPGVVVATPSRDAVATPGSQHRCPHCRQPLAIIGVVIPAGAAIVTVPEPPMTPS